MSYILRFLSSVVYYQISCLFPLTINYVSSPIYGIWMTLYSIISWLSIFDIGLGNGLRNNLTKCLVEGNYKDAKEYVSTAYVSLIFISLTTFLRILFFCFSTELE